MWMWVMLVLNTTETSGYVVAQLRKQRHNSLIRVDLQKQSFTKYP